MIDQVADTCSSVRGSASWVGILALRGIRHAMPGSFDDPENDTHWEVECETPSLSLPNGRVYTYYTQKGPSILGRGASPNLQAHQT